MAEPGSDALTFKRLIRRADSREGAIVRSYAIIAIGEEASVCGVVNDKIITNYRGGLGKEVLFLL